jgi:hypothetical protein
VQLHVATHVLGHLHNDNDMTINKPSTQQFVTKIFV